MNCPVKNPSALEKYRQCDKRECAWYDNAKEQCCIKTISQLKKIIVSGGINTHSY